MIKILMFALILFSIITASYSILAVSGITYKSNLKKSKEQNNLNRKYPSVDVFVPAHNEGVVIKDTLEALSKLKYKGKMEIYILNDSSTDETGEIAGEFDKTFKHIHHIEVPPGEPRGKSRVLNYGLSISNGDCFVVYDGDNQPEEYAVQLLVDAMLDEENAVGAVGTVKTINANSNLLTRMIAIEFQVFQLILQAGRWKTSKIGSLPGTNMLLKRSVVEEAGGYDEYALAEDAELTIRLTAQGKVIVVEPRSITWEQEPENLKALIKQRTRWLQGNIYLTFKFFRTKEWWTLKCLNHLVHYLTVYIIFPIILVPCNIIFILGLLNIVHIEDKIPFLIIWFIMYYTYTVQIFLAQWYDGTLGFKNMFIGASMYFTYAQLFMVMFFRAIVLYYKGKKNKTVEWDKTERVAIKKS